MGATNYARNKLKTVYAVLEHDDVEEYDVEDLRLNIIERMVAEFSKRKDLTVSEVDGSDNERNYTGSYIFEVEQRDGINIVGKMCNGYYQGANLEIEYRYQGEEYNNLDDILDNIRYWNEEKVPETKTRKDFQRMINGIERVYKKVSTPLGVTGTFSNGVTVYHKK